MRYSVKAHPDGFTVRQEGTGDILTFEFRSYLDKTQAQADARRVARELNREHEPECYVPTPEIRYTTDDDGAIRYVLNGVVSSERYANRVSAQFAARAESRRA